MAKDQPKNSRVTNVQVPGEQPKPAATPVTDKQPDTANSAITLAGEGKTTVTLSDETSQHLKGLGLTPADDDSTNNGSTGPAPALDLEALRAQIRAEEMGKLRAELGQQIEAASAVIAAPAVARHRSKADYRNMRAADVDPATLTAPVLTLDGYVCPPAPEAKK